MILGIDTSLGTAVAVIEPDGVVVAVADSSNPLGHAEAIGGLLEQVLAPADAITHVAVGMGPGPFTGLRVGIAAARAFALGQREGRGIPLVPVPSHDAAALSLLLGDAVAGADDTAPFAVVTDARRREFAYSVFEGTDDDGVAVRTAGPLLAPRDELDERLAALGAARRDVTAVPAAMVALAASRALAAGRELATSEPLYLRSPDVTLPGAPKKVTA
ncbi:tRNA (adenosine(37)-N6)-threonylcarbamoyltransferase complex dimerization subunit type 1 TsaB [Microbacterium sp. ET2]|uniref:tRNA (adenosine(37)-N6)-threonylcarbamoyltransferase complex dimerization subunit type 1 TsaB n=1 Tax=Microbacterium albipurpureum TaxID=3050384 RepID=UPI00259C79BF|nr:tRNA (adenosine(37)-N6)-threonylcarbamoyltransferase complex dimerization subunit type 1 TsaB [Microbacterium sp. ET2 (Ac-2212)]WJL94824.1 tRNA (adenosine(37)-N6)-threonylcarbamoyltransferase complex dimerization subunit type 1 TsaB [Microbacterium sp. ET2 (Ac-2212)]